jgi:predicted dehydrogenase
MDKIKIGVVGIHRGGTYVKVFHNTGRSEITAICDLDEAHLEAARQEIGLREEQCFTDYDAFVQSDIDVVVIGTPIPFHEEQVIKALEAGKHVFSEVTMAHTVEGCWNIYEAVKKARAKGIKYMLAENYVYLDFIEKWKKYVDDGRIGNIHYAEAEYVHNIRKLLIDKSSGETFWRTYRPPIHYCTHCLGPLLHLIPGDYIVKATAWGNQNKILPDPELWPSTIDMQVAVFETKEGRILKILRSQVTPRHNHIVTYNVYGTKGSLETGRTPGYDTVGWRYFEGSDKRITPMNCNGTRLDAPLYAKEASTHGTADWYGAQDFLDCILYDREPMLNVERGLEMTLPGLIAQEAALQGHVWLDVPHF